MLPLRLSNSNDTQLDILLTASPCAIGLHNVCRVHVAPSSREGGKHSAKNMHGFPPIRCRKGKRRLRFCAAFDKSSDEEPLIFKSFGPN